MAAINFPNPGLQTPLNTFGPNSSPARTVNGITYVWNGVGWRISGTGGGGGGGASVTISETAPTPASEGDLWWDSGLPASLFIYYIDQDSQQWVPATPVVDFWFVNNGTLVTAQTGQAVKINGRFTVASNDVATIQRTDGDGANTVLALEDENAAKIWYCQGDGRTFQTGNATVAGNITSTGNLTYGDYIVSDGETQTLQNDAGIFLREDGLGTDWNVKLLNNGTMTLRNQSDTGDRTVVFRVKDKAGTDVLVIDNDAIVTGGNFNAGSNTGKGYLLYQEDGADTASIQVQSPNTVSDDAAAFVVRRGQTVPYSINYDGSVISSAVTLTLPSGNLNVGDRLKKADDALTAIKAAATDASTDLAGLKAAIVAALTNH